MDVVFCVGMCCILWIDFIIFLDFLKELLGEIIKLRIKKKYGRQNSSIERLISVQAQRTPPAL